MSSSLGRIGMWLVAAGVGVLVVVAAPGTAWGHGEEVEVVVEALARGGHDLGVVDYGIALTFADGDPVTDATVTITAQPEDDVSIEPVLETVPGVYIAGLTLPDLGIWRVTVSFDHPEAAGSVEFSQAVREPAPGAPVVLVDTVNPDRIGTVALDESSILGPALATPVVGSHAGEVVVEAFVEDAADPLHIDYAAAVTNLGTPIVGATLTIHGTSASGATIEPTVLTDEDGVHRATIAYPAAGIWTLTLDMALPTGTEQLEFVENLPWPHYTTEAGRPKVKYDNEHPDRIGTIATPGESLYLSGALSSTTNDATTIAPTTATTEVGSGDVVLNLPDTADELRQDILLRYMHLFAIALWAVPLFAFALRRSGRLTVPITLAGMGLAIVTGLLLSVYGAPLASPGLFRWGELQERLYGPSYSAAFIAKMIAVAVAAVATVVWSLRHERVAAWLTLGGMAGALVAVTAMSQFHLFSHL